MKIHKLNESTRSLMRSSFILTDLNSITDELIANALDAHATSIEITINLDTFSLTVCDNGNGITFENMQKLAERHHTSKNVNDTMRGITSLGYKGEALASLSQISMLQIISKNKYNHNICSKLMRGGKLISIKNNINSVKNNPYLENKSNGTIIIVKDMFFNLKIRRQDIFGAKNDKKTFKKTVVLLQSDLIKWAVAHYDIQFILNNYDNKINKIICKSKGYSGPKYVLSSLIDPDLIKYLYSFDSDELFENNNVNKNTNNSKDILCCMNDDNVRIWGVLCNVQRLYHKKNWQLIFLNKRCIEYNKIYNNIIDFLMKINKCLKSNNDGMNLNINTNKNINTRNDKERVPWYSHKENKHHKYPIFAVFIETNPQNIMMENDTRKLHVLIKNEEQVLKKLKSTLLRVAHKMYPTLRCISEWKDEFCEINDNNTAITTECSDVIRNIFQEEEEKLICEEISKGNDNDNDNNKEETAPLHECSIISTPSTSPTKSDLISPSPPIQLQIIQKKQKELHLWSLQRKKNKKRRFSEIDNYHKTYGHYKNISSPQKKQKLINEYFDDDLDELISINTDNFFDDHFPKIPQNLNKIKCKDTDSIIIANKQTNDLMNSLLLNNNNNNNNNSMRCQTQTVNGEQFFDINVADFKNILIQNNGNNVDNNHNCKSHKTDIKQEENEDIITKHIMDIIDGEIKLSTILKEWREKCVNINENNENEIPIHDIGQNDIIISKTDLLELELFGIGQIDKKWIITILKKYGIIILIDQHAADERIRVERLTSFLCNENGPNSFRIKSTKLLIPYEIFIEYNEFEALNGNNEWIKKWGFGYEILEKNKIKVYKTPLIYGSTISVDELRELLHNICEMNYENIKSYVPKCIRRVLASKACRSAVKFGDVLNDKQMRNLLKGLAQCKLPYQCAHGRPTLFPISDLKKIQYDDNNNVKFNVNVRAVV